eukprot:Ihof_evm8s25 gene=Ihof_evmTU8s25
MVRPWLLYMVLALGRFLLVLIPQTGYIHPDEFFQAPEPIAGDIFGYNVLRPWEFIGQQPIRSIIFPFITCVIPFRILKWLNTLFPAMVSPYMLLIGPRLVMCSLSFIMDLCIFKLSQILDVNPWPSLVTLASSYSVIVFCCRPFSNGVETFIVAMLIVCVVSPRKTEEKPLIKTNRHWIWDALIGLLAAVGLFNRFTVVVFLFPLAIYWLYDESSHQIRAGKPLWPTILQGIYKGMIKIFVPFMAWAAMFVVFDSIYFNTLIIEWRSREVSSWLPIKTTGSLTITPYNALKYNLDTSNLKIHGIHPRATHLLVNMTLLFGPIAWGYFYLLFKLVKCLCLHLWTEEGKRSVTDIVFTLLPPLGQSKGIVSRPRVTIVLISCVIVPILLLSIQPHQEARFILPVLVPLITIIAPSTLKTRYRQVGWLVFNVIMIAFYGYIHQGGVYPSLVDISNSINRSHDSGPDLDITCQSHHVIFYRTYMPPRYLLQHAPQIPAHTVTVYDLAGGDSQLLFDSVDRIISIGANLPPGCPNNANNLW